MGDGLVEFFTEMNINWWAVNKETKTLFPDDPIYRFYFGLPAAEALKRAAALVPHALRSMGVPAASAAWLEVPSTYLICTEDNALTLEFQREIMKRAQAEGANMRTVEMKTGHSPWLVDVGVFVGHLLDAVNTGI
ncbi:uncharacterized protein ACHE_51055A [Aspergillus chevalieri]|uniref:AB hydrolase-1 domain-containing protein n=1 Tax=Aspergillus chevalieri TaxID=182096 RepID=A0A7R7VSE3_ASPCH|nr:uncharacterized protein ACHE_51055A [Aspergillus chevalieri]BCR89857.1 hypothetical protein ACHE_51055A [Aspergillus chevalieri]